MTLTECHYSGIPQGQVIKGWDQGILGMWYGVSSFALLRILSLNLSEKG